MAGMTEPLIAAGRRDGGVVAAATGLCEGVSWEVAPGVHGEAGGGGELRGNRLRILPFVGSLLWELRSRDANLFPPKNRPASTRARARPAARVVGNQWRGWGRERLWRGASWSLVTSTLTKCGAAFFHAVFFTATASISYLRAGGRQLVMVVRVGKGAEKYSR